MAGGIRDGRPFRVLADALGHFNDDDGWAMASHVALSLLLALFPFLLFVATLAGTFGGAYLAQEVAELVFDAWPKATAQPIAEQVSTLLTTSNTDLLTIGFVLSLFFASNGIEALRAALNRAYRSHESRPFWYCRGQSILFVIVGAAIMLIFAAVVIIAPAITERMIDRFSWLEPLARIPDMTRHAAAAGILTITLFACHMILPAGRRRLRDLLPGILATAFFWILCGWGFAYYLRTFANYAATYAGLAGVMTSILFLYLIAVVFILGGELNAAIIRSRSDADEAK